MRKTPLRRGLLVAVALGALAAPALATPAQAAPALASETSEERVVAGLERHAHPLRSTRPDTPGHDLKALSALVRDAEIVGIGEATHSSKELFTLRHRLFRHLATTQGFTTLALEAPWSAGVRLDEYVRTGKGDLRTIIEEEGETTGGVWSTKEWLDLYSWMRDYNRTARTKLRVMGFDLSDVHPQQYRRILDWAEEHEPSILPELRRRYAKLLALPGGAKERVDALTALPPEQLKALAEDAEAAYHLVEKAGKVSPYVLQEARVIYQMTTVYASEGSELHRNRDRFMAENTMWWKRNTGLKIVAAAHNGHVTYLSPYPQHYPVTQGAQLRAMAGRSYVAIGTSIHSGGFRAINPDNGKTENFDTGAAGPDSNEHILDKVRHRDYYVSLREAERDPATRKWLDTARPTFTVPATYLPDMLKAPLALGQAYDIVVHLHRVKAANPL
ncbi:erythromycin esterase [Streptosporangium becharense]|uniref:Erythromycin esterase n=1 Tax=Streptosporangium becharense TaxID=1816182 RepID=A0A7W9MHQ0_9ACTN|nr:erythromycin esterase family protein [Streptosporangium becharense]MBB2912360.1 erythromycin esterase [Streptosporangium becharense]MBB5820811.1 erythromycin esterase [Streptosporangium becharense]